MGEIVINCCRLCLKENYSLNNIFSSQSPSGDLVYSALNFVYDLQICPGDGLPPRICSPCMWKMLEFYTYKKNVHFAKAEIVKLLNEVSMEDCSNRGNDDTSVDSDSAHSVRIREEMEIVEWQMPEELKREVVDIEEQGIEPVFHNDRNIDNGSGSSKVMLQGIDLEVKQEESELIIDKVGAIQFTGSSDSKNHMSLEASEETVGNSFEVESICTTQDNYVEIRDTNKEIHENDFRDDVVPDEESTSAELSESIPNVTKSGQTHSKSPLSKLKSGFNCDICKKHFITKHNLGSHVRVHYDERPFSCNVCKKTFKQDTVRYRHELRHLRDKISFGKCKTGNKKNQYSCGVCAKNFSTRSGLIGHTNRHSNKYKCNFCGKTFKCNATLMAHVRIHTKEKPFNCEVCSKCFTRKNDLKKHLLIHSSERSFSCDTCDKRFKSKQEKTVHALYHLRKE